MPAVAWDGEAGAEQARPDPASGGGESPLKIVRGVLGTLLGAALVLFFIAVLFLAVITRQNSEGVPTAFGQRAFVVLSGSMTGTFSAGDLILDRVPTAQQANHLYKGQVISFEETTKGGGLLAVISHRIYRVQHTLDAKTQTRVTTYETKGDANPQPDRNRVLPQEVLGVYEGRIPYAGYVLNALHQPVTFVLVVSLPFAVLILLEARRRWKAVKPEG